MEFLPSKISSLWFNYGIELLVLANLVFQIISTYNGSRRRKTAGNKIRLSVWLAYVLVPKVAAIVLGKLMTIDIGTERNAHTQIQALLAPLMLMQMGSADTITAYSIEDNDQGVRQVFSMVVQVVITFYILVRSWVDFKTSFLYIPMSLAGIIKYGETSWTLMSAPKRNSGFKYADFFQFDEAIHFTKLPEGDNELPEAKLIMILRAYYRFCWFKPHLENWLPRPPRQRDFSKLYISHLTYEEAFKVTDCELGFMYDVLYTKAPIVYTRKDLFLRFISLISLIATLCGFSVLFKDAFVYNISVGLIHFALITSVILEVYQILRLPFSDCAMVQLIRHHKTFPIIRPLLQSLAPKSATWRRWSNTMGQFNLLDFCLQAKHRYYSRSKILRHWGLFMKIKKQLSVRRIEVHSKVKELAFMELTRKLY